MPRKPTNKGADTVGYKDDIKSERIPNPYEKGAGNADFVEEIIPVDQAKIVQDEDVLRLATTEDQGRAIQRPDILVEQISTASGRVPEWCTVKDWKGLGGSCSTDVIAEALDLVYIAGPMRGYDNFNFPAFDEGRDYVNTLKSPLHNWAAISPADMDRARGFVEDDPDHQDVSVEFYQNCMRRDVDVVSHAFAILLLRGWEKSTGANTELFVARACGVKVWVALYDEDGKLFNHVEAPDWLRSPLIYGDDGEPNPDMSLIKTQIDEALDPDNIDGAIDRRQGGLTLEGAAVSEAWMNEEIDQTLDVPPVHFTTGDTGLGELPDPTILEEANHLIFGPRNADYGHPADDFTRTGRMWGAIIHELKPGEPVTAEQVGLCMVALKISREVNRPKRDNLVDIAGYAGTLQMIHDREGITG